MVLDRIPLQRAVAVVTDDSIAVRPARAQLVGAAIELGAAAGAIGLLVLLFDRLPIFVLMALLLLAVFLGPVGVLGLVYGAFGSSFIMERAKRTARWQQGFLGMGIGTSDLVPFEQIERVEVGGDFDLELAGGGRDDLVRWEVRVVKENGRTITVGTVVAARPVAGHGAERANRLCEAVAAMASVEARSVVPPPVEGETDEPEAAPPAAARPRRRYRRVGGRSE